ncbi:unnamed protein product [Somion occarium]|uniref:Uncharacterized protein n=1 Tax=Somion occarium TaxID=3059160 RepID=A0ABP1E3H2_9APHY
MSHSVYTTTSQSSTSSADTNRSSNMSSTPSSPTPSIAALPSFTHSLSSFPTMTSVAHDMVHYGNLGRTKNVSEAKLNTVLSTTRQKRDAASSPNSPSQSPVSPGSAISLPEDDEQPLIITRRKHKLPTQRAV